MKLHTSQRFLSSSISSSSQFLIGIPLAGTNVTKLAKLLELRRHEGSGKQERLRQGEGEEAGGYSGECKVIDIIIVFVVIIKVSCLILQKVGKGVD